jgi:hypothetical protein
MTRSVNGGLIAGVMLVVTACALAGKTAHEMGPLIESARTKADHEALAAHYEQEAKALQDKAAEHETMAQKYQRGAYGKTATTMIQHCEFLARTYRGAAKENLELAKEHHELAKAAPQ